MKADRLTTLNCRLTIQACLGSVLQLLSCWFERSLSVFKWSLLSAVLIFSATLAHAAPIGLDARDNALGMADEFGYARIVRELGEVALGEASATYPLNLVFNSNPRTSPGAFGPYWRIPLFASTVAHNKQYSLYWDAPDEVRYFFMENKGDTTSRRDRSYTETRHNWKATVGRSGEVLIEALDGSGWVFRYDEGQLQEFKLGDSADACRITWSGRGLPLYITNQSTNRRIFEIEYLGSTDPERIVIGDTRIEVEMGDGELTAPDGEAHYRNYRVRFLRSLSFEQAPTEHFTYSKADKRQRRVSVFNPAKKTILKTLDLAVNRMEISNDGQGGATDNWIEWEAKSGFITADSGASYRVKNDSWDPNIHEGAFDETPEAVEMTRLPEGGSEQRWSYDWKSGVRVYTDLATGEVIRRTLIMSVGPANGKLRKREVLKSGNWTLDRQNSYDPKGRPVRAVHGKDMRIWKWEDTRDGSEATEYLNGSIVRRTVYDATGDRPLEREIFDGSGDVELSRYSRDGKLTSLSRITDGILDEMTYNSDEKLVKRVIDGEVTFYREFDGYGELIFERTNDYTMRLETRGSSKYKNYEYNDGYRFIKEIN